MEKRTEAVQSRVEPSLRLKLQKYCTKHERSEAEVIRTLLKKFLKNISTKQEQST